MGCGESSTTIIIAEKGEVMEKLGNIIKEAIIYGNHQLFEPVEDEEEFIKRKEGEIEELLKGRGIKRNERTELYP